MKIIQIIPEFVLAGAETMCENLTYELIKLGHEVIVISMYDHRSAITERLEHKGVDIRYLHKKAGFDFSMITKMKKIFKDEKPDVIHTHLYLMPYAIPAAVLSGIKRRVHTVHNEADKENSKNARRLYSFFYKFCGVTPVALSEIIRDSIEKEYKIPQEEIPVILNGIDLANCIEKKDYSIKCKFKILHIGRFTEQKNHLRLLESFKIFHQKNHQSELLLIGDGEKRAEAENYVETHNLQDSVCFLGLQSDVYTYLCDADIFTLPSDYEGVPITLIEAMGTGLPIVATSVGGVPDMLVNGESAILCDKDAHEIACAFEDLYISEDKRKRLGMMAKTESIAFSSAKMAREYSQIYNNR